jgi:hypothetical protein
MERSRCLELTAVHPGRCASGAAGGGVLSFLGCEPSRHPLRVMTGDQWRSYRPKPLADLWIARLGRREEMMRRRSDETDQIASVSASHVRCTVSIERRSNADQRGRKPQIR